MSRMRKLNEKERLVLQLIYDTEKDVISAGDIRKLVKERYGDVFEWGEEYLGFYSRELENILDNFQRRDYIGKIFHFTHEDGYCTSGYKIFGKEVKLALEADH